MPIDPARFAHCRCVEQVDLHLHLHTEVLRHADYDDKDTIVIADFANSTGDPVFDDTLKTALTLALNQSPFLDVLTDNKVAATLKLMTLPV